MIDKRPQDSRRLTPTPAPAPCALLLGLAITPLLLQPITAPTTAPITASPPLDPVQFCVRSDHPSAACRLLPVVQGSPAYQPRPTTSPSSGRFCAASLPTP
jgi:hypothetical protein